MLLKQHNSYCRHRARAHSPDGHTDLVPMTDEDAPKLKVAAVNVKPEKIVEKLNNVEDDGSPDAKRVKDISNLIASKLSA